MKAGKFSRFLVCDEKGSIRELDRHEWDKHPIWNRTTRTTTISLLKHFVRNEISKKLVRTTPPRHIELMRRLSLVDYCPESDTGHLKWYPNGALIYDLLCEFAFHRIALPWGAFKVRNPLLYRQDSEEISALMGEFHERDYKTRSGRRRLVLRFASDPGVFPLLAKLSFSHAQMPLKVYEEAECFRREREGELVGLARVRNFHMTDMHALCTDQQSARTEFEHLSSLFKNLMNQTIGSLSWVMGWEGTQAFFEQNEDWITDICQRMEVPSFIKLMPEATHYYSMKNEYQAISPDGVNQQISTVQWDEKNGKRFGIRYIDETGKRRDVPIILHASSFGSIERTLWAILETAPRRQRPMLPFWLSPTQVRVIPVSDPYLDLCLDTADKIRGHGFRADVDDRSASLAFKIREAEKNWIPYIIVLGRKEAETGNLSIRDRFKGDTRTTEMRTLLKELEKAQNHAPKKPLYQASRITQRPIFTGHR